VHVVPPHVWQAARSTGAYTLVGCTVGPGFDFDDFEMLDTRQADRREMAARMHPNLAFLF
jgi:predicted cupin superfamily sugar epimerase